jgi:hypothetical protein
MGVTKTRLGVMMAVACFCFGCKGAGGALRIASVVAVTAARVATVAAVAVPASRGEGEPSYVPDAPQPVYYAPPEGQFAGPPPPAQAVVYRGQVIVQDPATGLWHAYQ